MNKTVSTIIALLLVIGGATGVIIADRFGWLPGSTPRDSQLVAGNLCRHQLGKDDCPFCTPALIEKLGMCGGHGVPEALCTRCNAKLIPAFKVENDWCAEHGLPESQCTICHPDLAKPTKAPSTPHLEQASAIRLIANEQAVPRSQRPPSFSCKTEQTLVEFANVDIARRAGLGIETAQRRPITQTLACNAELTYDGDHLSHLSPRAAGVVQRVLKQLGDLVEAGEVLAVIDSVELGSAKAEYLQSRSLVKLWRKNYERQLSLTESGVTAKRELLETETALTEAEISLDRAAQHLRNLGLTESQVDQVAESGQTTSLLDITAPFAGTVIDRHAVIGEVVDSEHTLFSIADTSTLWAILDIYESDARLVAVGQPVTLAVNSLRGETIGGTIAWVSTQVDPQTRTLKARASIDNASGLLRANMFARAGVTIHDREELVVVPKEAVQWEGCCNVVFVKKSETTFQPRKVRLGYETDGWCVVLAGLEPDEPIVTQGSFLLKTEIKKGSIGAGCCEAHGAK